MWIWIAAFLAGATFAAHVFVGTKEVRAPLFDAGMDAEPRQTLWLSWHVSSVLLATVTFGYVWAAIDASGWAAGVVAQVGTLGCFVWSLIHQRASGLSFRTLPQAPVFALTGIVGAVGLSLAA